MTKEYITEAIVLDEKESGELDKLIYFFTSDLGKVVAKAKSIRKITSKLSGHLQPLDLVRIRLVEKGGLQVVDAIMIRQFENSKEALALVQFIKTMTFEFHVDKKLWLALKKTLDNLKVTHMIPYKSLLEILGFAVDFAECSECKNRKVHYFFPQEQIFLCKKCGSSYRSLPASKKENLPDLVEI